MQSLVVGCLVDDSRMSGGRSCTAWARSEEDSSARNSVTGSTSGGGRIVRSVCKLTYVAPAVTHGAPVTKADECGA